MGMNTMQKTSRLRHKSLGLDAPQEAHLMQALRGAKMPATQSALNRIASLRANFGHLPAPPISVTKSASTSQ